MRHVYRCPLRWSDMDAFGHVNNVVFLRYLEEARIDLFFRVAREADAGTFASGSVVAHHEIDYLRPLTYRPEPVTIELWVTRLGGASLTVAYEVKDERETYARASTVVVPYDLAEGRPRRLTPQERTFAEKYRDDAHGDDAYGV
ncbi:thioesterase family protein [Streptomyces sp. 7-21]|uniref:acyl-CoA thioesterase n=1 Tax=Streptomyces sp. 7-21 TaxID=2802283 RepID=UPI00191F97EB|nr:thioesterase family protein [Streptomyces sp. 7-21]MBL1066477.1 acyl-CoA thioesterase [Streptomyces sp. 7-21]